MIHRQTTHPLLPALRRLPGPLEQLVQSLVERLLSRWTYGALELRTADGQIVCAGDKESEERAVIAVHNRGFFSRLVLRGELGLGESYVASEWDSPNLVESLRLFLRNLDVLEVENTLTRVASLPARARHRLRRNNRRGSASNIHAHYDLGNDFYRLFLGDSWTYSCGYWRDGANSLEEAQFAKVDRLLSGLELKASDHLLEVGCGWGSLAIRAAQTTGCRVTGITVSHEQLELGKQRVADAGLSERVELRYCDYRDLEGTFDHVASVEMIEAVGFEYLDGFFRACHQRLKPGGKFALQSITMPDYKFDAYRRAIDWTQLYIFPGALIPSVGALAASWSRAGLDLEKLDDIGTDYAPTLAEWRKRFREQLAGVRRLGFDAPFERLWNLYLAFSEAAFAERSLGDAQILLSKRP